MKRGLTCETKSEEKENSDGS